MNDRGYRSDRLDGSSEKEDVPEDSDDTATSDTARTTVGMDDYFFQNYVRACKNVSESTSYLEIFNYSVRLPPVCRAQLKGDLVDGGKGEGRREHRGGNVICSAWDGMW